MPADVVHVTTAGRCRREGNCNLGLETRKAVQCPRAELAGADRHQQHVQRFGGRFKNGDTCGAIFSSQHTWGMSRVRLDNMPLVAWLECITSGNPGI